MNRWRREDGQAASEYLVIVGVTLVIVVASLAIMVGPVAWTFVALVRRIVTDLSS